MEPKSTITTISVRGTIGGKSCFIPLLKVVSLETGDLMLSQLPGFPAFESETESNAAGEEMIHSLGLTILSGFKTN